MHQEVVQLGVVLILIGKVAFTYIFGDEAHLEVLKRNESNGIAHYPIGREGDMGCTQVHKLIWLVRVFGFVVNILVLTIRDIGCPLPLRAKEYIGIYLYTSTIAFSTITTERIACFVNIPSEYQLVFVLHIIQIGIEFYLICTISPAQFEVIDFFRFRQFGTFLLVLSILLIIISVRLFGSMSKRKIEGMVRG